MSTPRTFNCKTLQDIIECNKIIAKGGIIIFPTDTVYGIGCNPYLPESVSKIFAIKKRTFNKPLPILTHNLSGVNKIIHMTEIGKMLAKQYWPGPLTIIGRKKDNKLPDLISAGKDTIAIRIPKNSCLLSLLRLCNYLVGTSANISSNEPVKSADQIINSNLDGFDAILAQDYNNKPSGKESTIVDISNDKIKIIREGMIKSKDINLIIKK